ncbi:hypothetical protein H6771_02950 [Candidatus Peribacteria bacterium]|nr:hypothetical protein [Candidatus Peribacteria bacterium]
MFDLYHQRRPLSSADHPGAFARSGRDNYWVEMATGEQCILDVQALNMLSLQAPTGSVEVLVSNYPYQQVDPSGVNQYQTVPSLSGTHYVTPNPDALWVSYGVTLSELCTVNVASLTQVQLRALSATTFHAQVSDEEGITTGLSAMPLSEVPPAPTPQTDYAFALGYDQNGNSILREAVYDEVSGTLSITYTDPITGADQTATTTLFTEDITQSAPTTECYTAIASGTGYAMGETVQLLSFWSTTDGTLMSRVWYNVTTGAVLSAAPSMADLAPCGTAEQHYSVLPLCDSDPATGLRTPFLRHLVVENGSPLTVTDTLLDGLTPYTPQYIVQPCGTGSGLITTTEDRYYWAGGATTANTPEYRIGDLLRYAQAMTTSGVLVYEQWENRSTGQMIPLSSAPLLTDTLPDTETRTVSYEVAVVDALTPSALTPPPGYHCSHAHVQVRPAKDLLLRAKGDTTDPNVSESVAEAQMLIDHSMNYTADGVQLPAFTPYNDATASTGHEAGRWTEIILYGEEIAAFRALSRRESPTPPQGDNALTLSVHYVIGAVSPR